MTEMINTRSCNFDPIVYMSKYTIKCKKLHYSVPQFYDDIPAIISYDNEANTLKIFNIEEKTIPLLNIIKRLFNIQI